MKLVIAAVVVVTLFTAFALAARRLLILATVDGPSMEPTFRSGERVLIRRTSRPRRGHVVLMRLPARPGYRPDSQLLLKRVVAVPGDHVPDGWASPDVHGIGDAEVPHGHYVVLGDNRPVSTDSRYFGLVPRDRVVGVMVRPFPGGVARMARGRHAAARPKPHGAPAGAAEGAAAAVPRRR